MIEINGKKYKINLDIKWGTQKKMMEIQKDPSDPDNVNLMEPILKDMLDPAPTNKQLSEFRTSDIERVFSEFSTEMDNLDTDFKKKRT